jgi:hypothetical protein
MADKEFTYSDVSEHTTKKDLYMVIHDKVYDCSSFVDEHPYVGPLIYAAHPPQRFAQDVSKHPHICFGNNITVLRGTEMANIEQQRW